MKYTPKQYAQALYELSRDTSQEDFESVIKSFVKQLRKKNALTLEKKIVSEFSRIYNEMHHVQEIDIQSAHKLEKESVQHIFGDHAQVSVVQDKSLIGGASIQIGDTRIDNTIKARVDKLKKAIS